MGLARMYSFLHSHAGSLARSCHKRQCSLLLLQAYAREGSGSQAPVLESWAISCLYDSMSECLHARMQENRVMRQCISFGQDFASPSLLVLFI